MIEELSGLPAGVIGFETTGKLRAEDYRDVVLPALERAAAGGEVRFVVVISEFTDIEWVDHMITLFGWMTPGEVRHFPLAQRDEAIAWAAAQ
jgi:hypothetical protein